MCSEEVVVSYVLLISCKLFGWNKYKTYPSLPPFKLLWSSSLFHPFRKVESQKPKNRIQDASKIVLYESSCFWKGSFRFHLFGWQALELNQTQPISLESMTFEAPMTQRTHLWCAAALILLEICWPWFAVDVLCNTCIFLDQTWGCWKFSPASTVFSFQV